MESSKFIQLSEGILVEYVYTSQSNPTVFNTSAFPIEILRDGYTGGSYMFNTDSVSATMGNYRDISAVPINAGKTRYVYLNTSVGTPYNDFDPNLTPSSNLLQTFSPNVNIEYDRIRVHFVAGFSFQDFDGIIFNIAAPRRDGKDIVLSSINFLKTDSPVFNPDPLLIADKLYSTYIEWRIPALFYMNGSFSVNNSNTLGYKLTEGQGFIGTPYLTISALGILNTTITNGYNFYEIKEINSTTIPNRDIYDNLYANVVESASGDYFELTGLVTGSTLSNFIAQLNSSGGNYIVFHEITLSEQIDTNFIQTGNQIVTQTTNFDDPILYRPIVLNSSIAVSFAINYVLRLYNRNDNTQIIKNARLTSFDVKKYGRRLMKINLGVVPTVANVVNQIDPKDGRNIVVSTGSSLGNRSGQSSEQITAQLVVKTKYVTSFRDRLNIKAAISPAKIQNIIDEDFTALNAQATSRNITN
jgi:hypothetical protein